MNPWLSHVKKFREKHPNMSYKEALQGARKSYKPMKGGSVKRGINPEIIGKIKKF
jgi:hypothetical protein